MIDEAQNHTHKENTTYSYPNTINHQVQLNTVPNIPNEQNNKMFNPFFGNFFPPQQPMLPKIEFSDDDPIINISHQSNKSLNLYEVPHFQMQRQPFHFPPHEPYIPSNEMTQKRHRLINKKK
jgi:hypothetical protein